MKEKMRGLKVWSNFIFNDAATTEIYTLSLHDALPISFRPIAGSKHLHLHYNFTGFTAETVLKSLRQDRKSTRLNSSHANMSYAVFCLKKKIITFVLSRSSFSSLHSLHCRFLCWSLLLA